MGSTSKTLKGRLPKEYSDVPNMGLWDDGAGGYVQAPIPDGVDAPDMSVDDMNALTDRTMNVNNPVAFGQKMAANLTPDQLKRYAPAPAPKPAVALRPPKAGVGADYSNEMLDEARGGASPEALAAGTPRGMPPLMQLIAGAAKPGPRVVPEIANEHPAVQEALKSAGFVSALSDGSRVSNALERLGDSYRHVPEGTDVIEARQSRRAAGDAERAMEAQKLAAAQAESDPDSSASVAARGVLAKMGLDDPKFARITAKDAKALFPEMKAVMELEARRIDQQTARDDRTAAREDQQSFQAQQNALTRQNSRDIANMTRDLKQQDKLDERQVGGFTFAPRMTPSKKSADEMQKTVSSSNSVEGALADMEDIYKSKGAEFGFGEDKARSETAKTAAMLQLKELENLGVLNGKDLEILNKMLPDPNSLSGALFHDSTLAQFQQFKKELKRRVDANAAARGYIRQGGGGEQAAPDRRVINGHTYERAPDGGWDEVS